MTLIFMHSTQSSHCLHGLWLICSGWQGSKGLGSAATGTWGGKCQAPSTPPEQLLRGPRHKYHCPTSTAWSGTLGASQPTSQVSSKQELDALTSSNVITVLSFVLCRNNSDMYVHFNITRREGHMEKVGDSSACSHFHTACSRWECGAIVLLCCSVEKVWTWNRGASLSHL